MRNKEKNGCMKNIFKSIVWIILWVLTQGIVQMAFSFYAAANGITDMTLMNEWLLERLLLEAIIYNSLFVLLAVLICKIKKVNLKNEWKIVKLDAKSYIIPCLIAFAYSMFYNLITYNPVANNTSMTHISAEFYGVYGLPLMALVLLVAAPVTEEIVCRAIMMNTLKRSFSAKTAIIISSIIFGAIHIMAGGIQLAAGAMVMGLVLAIIYEKSNSLLIAIVAHAVANLPDFIFYSSPQINNILRIVLAVIMLGFSLGLILVWYKPKQTPK